MAIEENEKPKEFYLKANTGILESLGHNMYTSVAKSLVEFVANGFDAEATEVKLNIPFEDIEKAREDGIKTFNKKKEQGQTTLELLQSTVSPISSNESFDTLLKRINNEMKIDNKADISSNHFDEERPDLVFLISSTGYHNIIIVELKSPAIPLNNNHLNQLEKYMMKTKTYVKQELPKVDSKVTGFLIGSMPDINTTNDDEKLLIDKMKLRQDWEVLSLQDLVERAKISHIQALEVLESEESKDKQ